MDFVTPKEINRCRTGNKLPAFMQSVIQALGGMHTYTVPGIARKASHVNIFSDLSLIPISPLLKFFSFIVEEKNQQR